MKKWVFPLIIVLFVVSIVVGVFLSSDSSTPLLDPVNVSPNNSAPLPDPVNVSPNNSAPLPDPVNVSPNNSTPLPGAADATHADVQQVVSANNAFAFDFYKQLNPSVEENVFYSPYSISVAFAMLYEGARGQTADEIRSVFSFPEDDVLRKGSASVYNTINQGNKSYTLDTGNALWVQEKFPILESYLSTVESYYGGEARNLNFVVEPEPSRMIINDFIEEQTRDRIKELLPKDSITDVTRLVLTNAIYFKGDWLIPFNEESTMDEDFTTGKGELVQTPTMFLGGSFRYAENDEVQVLELPYEGEELSMLLLLPKENDVVGFEHSLDADKLDALRKDLSYSAVDVYLPKFKLEEDYDLMGYLSELGMPTVFSESDANLSGIVRPSELRANLFVSGAFHKAFVEVNEKGTEAAAATGIVAGIDSTINPPPPPPPIFRADHPFLFIIQENETGNILFMGRVSDPTV